jgi:hypothetical protein
MPSLEPVHDASGTLADATISYPGDFTAQMLAYADATRAEREVMLRVIAAER